MVWESGLLGSIPSSGRRVGLVALARGVGSQDSWVAFSAEGGEWGLMVRGKGVAESQNDWFLFLDLPLTLVKSLPLLVPLFPTPPFVYTHCCFSTFPGQSPLN